MEYFQMIGLGSNYNKSEQEIEDAIAGNVAVDINNDAYIQPKLAAAKKAAENNLATQDPTRLSNAIQRHDLHSLDTALFYFYWIEVDRLNQNAASFAKRVSQQIKDYDFNWQIWVQDKKSWMRSLELPKWLIPKSKSCL